MKHSSSILSCCLLLVLTVFLSCTTIHLNSGPITNSVDMTNKVDRKYRIIRHFDREVKGWFTINGLVTIADVDNKFQRLVLEELQATRGDAVINVRVKGQTDIVDVLIPLAPGVIGALISYPWGAYASWLICSRTYTIEGDVIKYEE